MLTKIIHENQLLAIIIHNDFYREGISFFTPESFSQQLGYMNRPKGYTIPPHTHNPVIREVSMTKEVLFIKSGIVRVDFYDDNKKYLESKVLSKGDVVLLAYGGHGFQILQDAEIIEVKQGPYAGNQDKTHFKPVCSSMIKISGDSPDD